MDSQTVSDGCGLIILSQMGLDCSVQTNCYTNPLLHAIGICVALKILCYISLQKFSTNPWDLTVWYLESCRFLGCCMWQDLKVKYHVPSRIYGPCLKSCNWQTWDTLFKSRHPLQICFREEAITSPVLLLWAMFTFLLLNFLIFVTVGFSLCDIVSKYKYIVSKEFTEERKICSLQIECFPLKYLSWFWPRMELIFAITRRGCG